MERAAIVVAVMMTLAMPGAAPAAEAASVQELYRLSYATEARGDPAGALHFMDEAVKQGETPDALKAVAMTVAQMDKVPPKAKPVEDDEPPAPAPKAKKAAPAPEPEAATEDEPPAPEPTKRKAAAKEAPEVPSKGKMADILSKWDDE